MQKQKILVAEDDDATRKLIGRQLAADDYRILFAAEGRETLTVLAQQHPDLVVLDLFMPGVDGMQIIRQVREESVVPIIVLSGAADEETKLRAFALGADDYIVKPYRAPDLRARVLALLRRASWYQVPDSTPSVRFGAIEMIPHERRVLRDGQPVPLTATEYNLLLALVNQAGRILTHEMLLQTVWGTSYREEAEYLRVYINRLRRKLEADPSHPRHILTEVGIGYRFERRG